MRGTKEMLGKIFKYKGVLWEPYYRTIVNLGDKRLSINGPFCLDCRVAISFQNTNGIEGKCPKCERQYQLENGYDDLRRLAHLAFEGKLREGLEVTSLDLPPTLVKSESENEDYWIEARLGQKNGKLMAIVYFGKKKREGQDKKDYSQVFLDFDDEQMRFDKGNKNPLEIIGKLKAEFLGSSHVSEKKG